jgi:DNA-directed RNA polymerase subunit D
MVSDVPTMAIEDIFYYDNTSVVPDEVLAHRLGLIPLKTDLVNYVLPSNCDCEAELGCPKCRVTLNLSVKAGEEKRVVYSGDLVPVDPAVAPVQAYIPLAKLAPGQSVSLEAYAQLGTGRQHTKFSPVSMAIYYNVAEIKTDPTMAAKCISDCPRGLLLVKKDIIKIIDIPAFNKTPSCVALLNGGILKDYMKNEEAVRILNAKLEELRSKIDKKDLHNDIEDFEAPQEVGRRLYAIGAGDFEEEEEGEEGGEPKFDEQ